MVKRIGRLSRVIALGAVAGLLFTWGLSPAYAHGEVLEVDPPEAGPGAEVTVSGGEFTAGEEVELSLEGIRGEFALGHAEVDEEGNFSVSLTIPAGAAAGLYQLVGATDEDRIPFDFTVLAGSSAQAPAGYSEVVFERSKLETVVIGVIAVVLAAAGTFLVVFEVRRRATVT